jgi:hypothetical protein
MFSISICSLFLHTICTNKQKTFAEKKNKTNMKRAYEKKRTTMTKLEVPRIIRKILAPYGGEDAIDTHIRIPGEKRVVSHMGGMCLVWDIESRKNLVVFPALLRQNRAMDGASVLMIIHKGYLIMEGVVLTKESLHEPVLFDAFGDAIFSKEPLLSVFDLATGALVRHVGPYDAHPLATLELSSCGTFVEGKSDSYYSHTEDITHYKLKIEELI